VGDGYGEIDWGDGLSSSKGWTDLTFKAIETKVESWLELARCQQAVMVFSDQLGRNFRKEFCPHYKENRKSDKPSDYSAAVRYIKSRWEHYELPTLEGDDVLGLMSQGEYVLMSTDKDIFTLPGTILRVGQHHEPWVNHEEDANRYWMTQTITGDTVDNYKGCPGAGPKKAAAVLSDVRSLNKMWERVLDVYAEMADDDRWGPKFTQANAYEEALMNARCARILRPGDYDNDTGKVTIWTP